MKINKRLADFKELFWYMVGTRPPMVYAENLDDEMVGACIFPNFYESLMLRGVIGDVHWVNLNGEKIRCEYCRQWTAQKESCEYCGAPV